MRAPSKDDFGFAKSRSLGLVAEPDTFVLTSTIISGRGFSILEVLVSIALFGAVSAFVHTSILTHIKINWENQIRSEAILVAQQVLDELRATDPETMPTNGYHDREVIVGTRPFQVRTHFCKNVSYCESPFSRHLTCEVSYSGALRYSTQTIYTQLN